MTGKALLRFDGYCYFWEAFGFKSMAFYDKRQSTQQLKYFEKLLNDPVLGTVQ